MSNHLSNETSPYLLQHAENPVDWFPWCQEAFDKAKEENKPIFLSIGYSTCHWCHVMAHESFEDIATAEILNNDFVCIKVDREERPDIDSVYMSVCQAFTGNGGWPMSIFMTWDKKPFYAGTYFPLKSRYGMPGFTELLKAIINQWKSNRQELFSAADEIIQHVKTMEPEQENSNEESLPQKAVEMFKHTFDEKYGGFGTAPKFPTPHNLLFLMLYASQNKDPKVMEMAEKTLIQMRKGGIFDHIGHGFSRYSTDKYYLAPHFEKMLYDNALLIIGYCSAFALTGNGIYLDTAEKTAGFIINEMADIKGGFYSAQDADSEGVEGRYYTFSLDEVIEILGEVKGRQFADTFDITQKGNFEGLNIPNLLHSNNFDTCFDNEISKLYSYRKNRYKLHLDDKILLAWNSMAISALCMVYRATKNKSYLHEAQKAADFAKQNLSNGLQLYTSYREGKHSNGAFLDDYAYYIAALIELYSSTLDDEYLGRAEALTNEAVKKFKDNDRGGYYLCESDSAELFINPKETYDGAVPSGNSMMAYNLVRLYQLTYNNDYKELSDEQIKYLSGASVRNPSAHCMLLVAMLLEENPPMHITVSLKEKRDLSALTEQLPFLANITVAKDKTAYPLINNQTTYYVCKNNTCFPPTNSI